VDVDSYLLTELVVDDTAAPHSIAVTVVRLTGNAVLVPDYTWLALDIAVERAVDNIVGELVAAGIAGTAGVAGIAAMGRHIVAADIVVGGDLAVVDTVDTVIERHFARLWQDPSPS
jgi:hypothetical protein